MLVLRLISNKSIAFQPAKRSSLHQDAPYRQKLRCLELYLNWFRPSIISDILASKNRMVDFRPLLPA